MGPVHRYTAIVLLAALPFLGMAAGQDQWKHLSTKNGDLQAPGVGSQVATLILDIDLDGTNDFVIAGWGEPSMVWYRRNTEGWDRYLIEPGVRYIEAGGAYHDIDGDGDLDIVMGGDWRTTKEVWWWENPHPDLSPGKPWKRHYVKNSDEGGKGHHDQVFGDFDGDGRHELVFWNQNAGKLFLAEIPEDPRGAVCWPLTVIYSFSAPEKHKFEGLTTGDINLDGKVDLVGAGRWFEHTSGTQYRAHEIDAAFYYSRSAVGDLKKGGRPEIAMSPGDATGPLTWYEWDGKAWRKHVLVEEVLHGHTLQIVDVDGDGNQDIFCAEMAEWASGRTKNPNCRAWIFYGDGKGGFRKTLLSEGIGHHESTIGDLDGDGDMDILGKPFESEVPRLEIWLQQ